MPRTGRSVPPLADVYLCILLTGIITLHGPASAPLPFGISTIGQKLCGPPVTIPLQVLCIRTRR
jgi:hypothetical protein